MSRKTWASTALSVVVPGLEARRGAEVVARRVHALTSCQRRDHLRRSVTDPQRCHVNERAVVGLERQAQVELEDAVPPEERPVAPARKHLSAQPWTLEVAGRDGCRAANPVRHGPDLLRGRHHDLQHHQQT
jgi:hypothetical protein